MSLEEKLEKLAEAVQANTEQLQLMTKAAKDGLASKTAKSTSTKKADDEGEADAKPAPKKRAPAKKKAPTVAALKKAATAFLDNDDEDEYRARAKFVKELCGKYEVDRISEVAEDERQEVLEALAEKEAELKAAESEEDEDDDIV